MALPDADRRTLSARRIVLLSVLSAGLYYLPWAYLTWKQMAHEVDGTFHPVWHALSLLVPVYAQFRIHRHTALIRELAATPGREPTLSPLAVVAILATAMAIGLLGLGESSPLIVASLLVANVALVTPAVVWSQGELNRYWARTRGDALRRAPLGVGEIVAATGGLGFVWSVPLVLVLFENASP